MYIFDVITTKELTKTLFYDRITYKKITIFSFEYNFNIMCTCMPLLVSNFFKHDSLSRDRYQFEKLIISYLKVARGVL